MTKNIASLGAGLIVTKGAATPSVEIPKQMPNKQVSIEKRIALTLKIVDVQYKKMKLLGIANNISTQSLLEEALDEYLSKHST